MCLGKERKTTERTTKSLQCHAGTCTPKPSNPSFKGGTGWGKHPRHTLVGGIKKEGAGLPVCPSKKRPDLHKLSFRNVERLTCDDATNVERNSSARIEHRQQRSCNHNGTQQQQASARRGRQQRARGLAAAAPRRHRRPKPGTRDTQHRNRASDCTRSHYSRGARGAPGPVPPRHIGAPPSTTPPAIKGPGAQRCSKR